MRLWIKSWSVTIEIEANEQYFPVVLFVALYNVVLNYASIKSCVDYVSIMRR